MRGAIYENSYGCNGRLRIRDAAGGETNLLAAKIAFRSIF